MKKSFVLQKCAAYLLGMMAHLQINVEKGYVLNRTAQNVLKKFRVGWLPVQDSDMKYILYKAWYRV